MRLLQPVLCVALLLLTAASITAQLSVESPPVVLPTGGTLDERPFFATRRHPAVNYDRPATDPVAQLARGVEDGSRGLRFEGRSGYLTAVLEALGVPKESQALVFSKTSLQAHYISPTNPRAIYFSDNISVAYVRDAPLLEIAALNPKQGVVFYALEQRPQGRPQIARSDSCLSCHESRNTMDVPGLLVRSMAVGHGGQTMPQFGNYVSDHRSPFEQRWGGWYITGKPGSARHMGNEMLEPDGTGRLKALPKPVTSVAGWFDLDGYPSDSSDVVAAMILQHQARMTNLLTRVGWESRIAVSQQPGNPQEKQAAQQLIAANARELVDYMLFVDEAPFPGKVISLSDFQTKFPVSGPRDRRGRSLRQLDLEKRLMRYPCSYMIYSGSFDELPGAAKDAVYARLWNVLSGQEKSTRYSRLSTTDRAAIVSILLDTKSDLPAYYRRLER